jgi:hypothetical protein
VAKTSILRQAVMRYPSTAGPITLLPTSCLKERLQRGGLEEHVKRPVGEKYAIHQMKECHYYG